jgi:nucleoside-diphosphate-sugar epimerase
VTDTVRGILKLATKAGLDGEVFNVGNTNEITILELAKTIIRKTQSRSKLKFMSPALDDPRRRCPDISKAKKLLGWEPKVDLEAGLDRLIASWKVELGASPVQKERA